MLYAVILALTEELDCTFCHRSSDCTADSSVLSLGRQFSCIAQRVFNAAARVVCLVPKFDHISPVLIHLHWLPAPYHVQYKILLLVFKCLLGEAPEYLRSMIQPKRKGRHSLRSESAVLLEVPRVRPSTIGGRAFAFTMTNLWNKLPTQLRNTKSLQTYK
jgi:hypothetical protein